MSRALFDSLGDKLLEVNGSSLARVTHAEAVDLFRRVIGSKCHLLVQRIIFPNSSRPSSSNSESYPFARAGISKHFPRTISFAFLFY